MHWSEHCTACMFLTKIDNIFWCTRSHPSWFIILLLTEASRLARFECAYVNLCMCVRKRGCRRQEKRERESEKIRPFIIYSNFCHCVMSARHMIWDLYLVPFKCCCRCTLIQRVWSEKKTSQLYGVCSCWRCYMDEQVSRYDWVEMECERTRHP